MKNKASNVRRSGGSLERMVGRPSVRSLFVDMMKVCKANPGMKITIGIETPTEPPPQNPRPRQSDPSSATGGPVTPDLSNDAPPPVRSSAWLADDGDTQWQCTVCGRIGMVGRCCGDETRKPVNEAARQEAKRIIKAANK